MSKRTLTLITILVVLSAFLVALSIFQQNKSPEPIQTVSQPSITPAPTKVAGHTVITLSPNPVTVTTGKRGQIDVLINTDIDTVSAVQLELSYDPLKLSNVTITTPATNGFFEAPLELLKKIDTKTGRITYAFGISPTGIPKKGIGTAAVITFNHTLKLNEQTSFAVLADSIATALGIQDSILKTATGTTIINFGATAAPTRVPTVSQ